MRNYLKGLGVVASTSLLVACAHVAPLSDAGANVKVSNQLPSRQCHLLGKITAKQSGQLVSGKKLEQGAMNLLRDLAAKRGANYVHINDNYANYFRSGYMQDGISSVVVDGHAYRCPK